jgi:hypothetical protein
MIYTNFNSFGINIINSSNVNDLKEHQSLQCYCDVKLC